MRKVEFFFLLVLVCERFVGKFFVVLVLRSLKESYDEALRRDDVKAIVVTGNELFEIC